jgi:uncharacterized membrane protein YphA (DoxX/SURF4 family)
MRAYEKVARIVFGLIFAGGGVVHLTVGQVASSSYAAFGTTATFVWLSNLWDAYVMPNIRWLTVIVGLFELACGSGLISKKAYPIGALVSACVMLLFFVLIFMLGYGLPASGPWDDFLKNRAFTIVLMLPILPLVIIELRNVRNLNGECARG